MYMDAHLGQELPRGREEGNGKDPYAVAALRENAVIGHVPRRISTACSLFLHREGSVHCIITAARRYSTDLPQGGMEVPCLLKFRGEHVDLMKLTKLLTLAKHGEFKSTYLARMKNLPRKTRSLIKAGSSLVKRNMSLEKAKSSLQLIRRKGIMMGIANPALLL